MASLADKKGLHEKPLTRKVNENHTRHIADALEQPPYSGKYEEMMDIIAV